MRLEAAGGLGRVARAYAPLPLLRSLRGHGAGPLALLAATATAHPERVAWRGTGVELTYAGVVTELRRRRPDAGPVLVRATGALDIVLDTLAAVGAGLPVAVLGPRSGTLAAEPARQGVTFLTSGTTGAPHAHASRGGAGSLRPYLGMLGRLPRLTAPVVGSPSSPDHGHTFLVVVLTWALAGTYVAVDGPAGQLDVLSGVPVQLRDTLDRGWCDSARIVVSGSDLLDPALATRLRTELGARVWDAYGATETGPISLGRPADVAAGTVGRPLPGVSVHAQAGRLRVRTPAAVGAFDGDLGSLDTAGRIRLAGRADGRLVAGGEVVDPRRLRAWLEAQPGVVSATVRTVPDERFGHRLVATVTGEGCDPDALRRRAGIELGGAHVPARLDLGTEGPPNP